MGIALVGEKNYAHEFQELRQELGEKRKMVVGCKKTTRENR